MSDTPLVKEGAAVMGAHKKHDVDAHTWIAVVAVFLLAISVGFVWEIMSLDVKDNALIAAHQQLAGEVISLREQAASLRQSVEELKASAISSVNRGGTSAATNSSESPGVNSPDVVQAKSKRHR